MASASIILICARSPSLRTNFLEKIVQQEAGYLPSVPERRQVDRDHVQAVVQILPERALRNLGLKVLVACGDDMHINLDVGGTSYAHELPFLEDPQELDLEAQALSR